MEKQEKLQENKTKIPYKQIKIVVNEGDCLRCPYCFSIVYGENGRCDSCGMEYRT